MRRDPKAMEFEFIDPGVSDKRLMVQEPEFGTALSVMKRADDTPSLAMRKA